MTSCRKHFFVVPLALLALLNTARAADDRIDELIAEVRALKEQVALLEDRIQALEGQRGLAESSETEGKRNDSRSWFDSMRVELKKAEVRASGSWTEPQSWTKISKGMKKEEVIDVLGEPTTIKFSVRKDTDEILVYEGDLTGEGQPARGEVRIYKGEVRRFEVPDLPAQ